MNLMRCAFLVAVLAGTVSSSVTRADSHPARVVDPPRFVPGTRVLWVDGSRGQVVAPGSWRERETESGWVYYVRLGGEDGLVWLLPESGLEILDDGSAPR